MDGARVVIPFISASSFLAQVSPNLLASVLGLLSMVEWDTSRAEGEMLEVWLLLPSSGCDLPDPEVAKPASGESRVISFVPFHPAGFGVPTHPFVQRFLHHFRLCLHDLTPHGVADLVVFVTLSECYLGIEPHFDLWRRIFQLNLTKDGNGSVQWIGATTV